MTQPLLLDLFAGAGVSGEGYARAGFRVVGCDRDPRPLRHNPHECYVGDALDVLDSFIAGVHWHGYALADVAVIHASPPCQDYSRSRHIGHAKPTVRYPRLIGPVRDRLLLLERQRPDLLWIIENVWDARDEMCSPLMLCGTSLGLRVWRHRLFESNALLFAAGPCQHRIADVSVRRKHAEYIGLSSGMTYQDATGYTRHRPKTASAAVAQAAMGIDWMTLEELGEAIPPAYTEWLGYQLMRQIAQTGRLVG